YTKHLSLLRLLPHTSRQLSLLQAAVAASRNVTYAFTDPITGTLAFVSAFREPADLDRLGRSLRSEHPIVARHSFFLIRDEPLFSLFPAGMLEEQP
ncbi:MAG TPA: hypothetical protein VJB16_06795, partial [archaeon]|nr:hypothetical protein [archaeon]